MLLSVCSRLLVFRAPNKSFRRGNESNRGLGKGFSTALGSGDGMAGTHLVRGDHGEGLWGALWRPAWAGGFKRAAVLFPHGTRNFGVWAASAIAPPLPPPKKVKIKYLHVSFQRAKATLRNLCSEKG